MMKEYRVIILILITILVTIIIFPVLWNITQEETSLEKELCERNNMTYSSGGGWYTGWCNIIKNDSVVSYRINRINNTYYYRINEVEIRK
jgi:hypothetical protein